MPTTDDADPADIDEADAAAADGAVTGPSASRPAPMVFHAPATRATVPGADRYSLRLVSHRALYDDGVHLRHARSLAPLAADHAAAVGV